MEKFEPRLAVSVVVVVYNMPREAPRTLHSLSASYQRHIDADDYEVIVVDNGSNPPFALFLRRELWKMLAAWRRKLAKQSSWSPP